MAGPSINWQTATSALEHAGGDLPSWNEVLRPTSLDEFSAWLDARLEQLEKEYADFTTPNSLARELAISRGAF